MFKWVALIKKKQGVSSAEFMDYYENRHIPLLIELFPQWEKAKLYRRNYLKFDDSVVAADNRDGVSDDAGFDVITEVMFETREDADALLGAAFKQPENFAKVLEDENNFIEPGNAKMYVVEVRETFA